MPKRWLSPGLVRSSNPRLFCFTPRTLENGSELLKYNFFFFSSIRWLSTFQMFLPQTLPVVKTPCDLSCLLVLWTLYYSKFYPVLNLYSVLKVLISDRFYLARLYYYITLCDWITFGTVFLERTFYSTVKSYETPHKRRIKIEPRFLAHLNPTVSESLDLSFLPEL